MQPCFYSLLRKLLLDRRAVRHVDNVQMARWDLIRRLFHRRNTIGGGESAVIDVRDQAALGIPGIQAGELDRKETRLQGIEAAVGSFCFVNVFVGLAVVTQQFDPAGNSIIVGRDGTRLATGAQVFSGIKTECGGNAERACGTALVGSAVGLGGVLYNDHSIPLCDFVDGVHIGALAIEMYRHDGIDFLLLRTLFQAFRVDQASTWIDVDEFRPRAGLGDGLYRGDKGIGHRGDGISRPDTTRLEGQFQGIGAAADADDARASDIAGKSLFKLRHGGPADKCCLIYGVRVTAIDSNAQALAEARARHVRANLTFVEGDAGRDLPPEHWDVIVLSNVLEHIDDRVGLLRRLVERHTPSRLLVRVPLFERHWHMPLRRELGVDYFSDPTHHIEHTLAEFEAEMEAAGLVVVERLTLWGEIWARCELPVA